MAGVRIQHPTYRNVRATIVEGDHPYKIPHRCAHPSLGGCGQIHVFKTHHINIDEAGAAIVNDVLFELIKPMILAEGFVIANVVKKPPAQGIDFREKRGPQEYIPVIQAKGDTGG